MSDGDDGSAAGGPAAEEGSTASGTAAGDDVADDLAGVPTPATLRDDGPSPAATAGLILAAFATIAAVVPWWPGTAPAAIVSVSSPVVAVLSLVALAAFGSRRHGALHRGVGAQIAGIAAGGMVVGSAVRLLGPAIQGVTVKAGYGLPVALVAGICCIGFAVADYRGVEAEDLVTMVQGVVFAVSITVLAFGGLILVSLPLSAFDGMASSEAGNIVLTLVLGTLGELGFVLVVVGYLFQTGRGWAYLDVEWPSLVEVVLALGGTLGLLILQFASIAVIQLLELPSSSQGTMQRAAESAQELGQPELVLVLVPLMLFVVAPIEELLFRNVIQKRLYGGFDRRSAVLVAGLVFAPAHILSYWNANHAAVFVSLSTIFFVSLLLGLLYEATENLTVPIVAHGLYNSTLVLLLYIGLVLQEMAGEEAAWLGLLF